MPQHADEMSVHPAGVGVGINILMGGDTCDKSGKDYVSEDDGDPRGKDEGDCGGEVEVEVEPGGEAEYDPGNGKGKGEIKGEGDVIYYYDDDNNGLSSVAKGAVSETDAALATADLGALSQVELLALADAQGLCRSCVTKVVVGPCGPTFLQCFTCLGAAVKAQKQPKPEPGEGRGQDMAIGQCADACLPFWKCAADNPSVFEDLEG